MSGGPGERAYRLLLRVHPREFRRRYEEELVACFREARREEAAGGWLPALRFWWKLVAGTLGTAWRQRFEGGWIERRRTNRERRSMTIPGGILDGMRQDGAYTLRMLRRSPAFAAAALATLGLGIGAATAVFTVVEGVLLAPLPFPEADRLFTVSQDGEDGSYWLSAPNYEDLARELPGVASMGAYSPEGANVIVDGAPARLSVAEADAAFFRTLAVEPVLGRTFTEEERQAGAAVAVVSYGVWQERYGGRTDVIGQTIVMDGLSREIIGVLPAGPTVPPDVDAWTPLILERPEWRTRRGISWIRVLARLDEGVDVSAVRTQAARVSERLRAAYPEENRSFEVGLRSVEESLLGAVRPQLRILMGAVALLLVVAAINVGGLLLARMTARRDELALRAALGGGPRRLMSQLLTETALFAILGVGVGLFLGRAGVAALVSLAPPGTPRVEEVALGANGLLFALVAGGVAALLFGVVPALTAARGQATVLRASRSGGGRAAVRMRDALVVAQVALALALLFGAGLLARSFWRLQQVDLGFEPRGVLVASLPLGDGQFTSEGAREAHYDALLSRAAALPGVRHAGLTSAAPFASYGTVFSFELPDVAEATGVEKLSRFRIATPDLFAALGIPLLRGRSFSTAPAREVVVSEELVRRWFPDRDPLGARLATSGDTFRIVGVAGAIRDVSARAESPFPHVYVPVQPSTRQSMTLVLRTDGDPVSLIGPLRRTVADFAPMQPITTLSPMTDLVADASARDRFTLALLAFFALASLLLASIGLYGVLAWGVSRRTREIGVRVALGAPVARVRAMVVTRGLALVGLGLATGLVLALWGGRFLQGMLFQVDARDPLVLIGVATTLLAVALLAAWLPARRATRIAPAEALRVE